VKNQDAQVEFEEPPGHGRPPHPWEDVSLTPEEVAGLSPLALLRVDITPYSASLMGHDDSKRPIPRQIVPAAHELVPFEAKPQELTRRPMLWPRATCLGLLHQWEENGET
jgi:L-lysine 2,3-aminomutase